MRKPNYDKFPSIPVPGERCWIGWDAIGDCLRQSVAARTSARCVVAVDTYPGVLDEEVLPALQRGLRPQLLVCAKDAMRSAADIDQRVAPDLGGDDPVFGRLSHLELEEFFDPRRRTELSRSIQSCKIGTILVYGTGAALLCPGGRPDILVYADMARWEIQMRQRRNQIGNLGADNRDLRASLNYKRAFFVDWRVADRHKRDLIDTWDFLLDTNAPDSPKLVTGEAVKTRRAATHATPSPL